MNRFAAAFFVAILAFNVARRCGVPVWTWLTPVDATDYALIAGFAVWFLIGALRA